MTANFILSGAPGFALLAICIAMAAYLRQVSASARDKIEAIISRNDAFWKGSDIYAKERVAILMRTRKFVQYITHAFFFIATAIAIRLAVNAWMSGGSTQPLFWFDGVIVSAIAIFIPAMWRTHAINRNRDDVNFQSMLVHLKSPLMPECLGGVHAPLISEGQYALGALTLFAIWIFLVLPFFWSR